VKRVTRSPAVAQRPGAIEPRLGLCCQFVDEPIKFHVTTAAALVRLPRRRQLERLTALALSNTDALFAALQFCADRGIGSFRILSPILPLKTHPDVGYTIDDLPGSAEIVERFRRCGAFAAQHDIRTGFHPDQFVVLNSPDPVVVERSLADLESQAEIAEWTHADTINIHGGGAYGDKAAALERFRRALDRLSPRARSRLTVENDDRIYTPTDLLPLCRAEGLPLVYDVHHHRCCADGLSVEEATHAARATWNREPLFHLSSPLEGWDGPRPERHHDFVDPHDFPPAWLGCPLTVEVEAKAKERAVARLQQWLQERK
jgi:UV DNA damage endonuclease